MICGVVGVVGNVLVVVVVVVTIPVAVGEVNVLGVVVVGSILS